MRMDKQALGEREGTGGCVGQGQEMQQEMAGQARRPCGQEGLVGPCASARVKRSEEDLPKHFGSLTLSCC